jgi:hypothetical protein
MENMPEARHAPSSPKFSRPNIWRAAARNIHAATPRGSAKSPRNPRSISAGWIRDCRRKLAAAFRRTDRIYDATPADCELGAESRLRGRSPPTYATARCRGQKLVLLNFLSAIAFKVGLRVRGFGITVSVWLAFGLPCTNLIALRGFCSRSTRAYR